MEQQNQQLETDAILALRDIILSNEKYMERHDTTASVLEDTATDDPIAASHGMKYFLPFSDSEAATKGATMSAKVSSEQEALLPGVLVSLSPSPKPHVATDATDEAIAYTLSAALGAAVLAPGAWDDIGPAICDSLLNYGGCIVDDCPSNPLGSHATLREVLFCPESTVSQPLSRVRFAHVSSRSLIDAVVSRSPGYNLDVVVPLLDAYLGPALGTSTATSPLGTQATREEAKRRWSRPVRQGAYFAVNRIPVAVVSLTYDSGLTWHEFTLPQHHPRSKAQGKRDHMDDRASHPQFPLSSAPFNTYLGPAATAAPVTHSARGATATSTGRSGFTRVLFYRTHSDTGSQLLHSSLRSRVHPTKLRGVTAPLVRASVSKAAVANKLLLHLHLQPFVEPAPTHTGAQSPATTFSPNGIFTATPHMFKPNPPAFPIDAFTAALRLAQDASRTALEATDPQLSALSRATGAEIEARTKAIQSDRSAVLNARLRAFRPWLKHTLVTLLRAVAGTPLFPEHTDHPATATVRDSLTRLAPALDTNAKKLAHSLIPRIADVHLRFAALDPEIISQRISGATSPFQRRHLQTMYRIAMGADPRVEAATLASASLPSNDDEVTTAALESAALATMDSTLVPPGPHQDHWVHFVTHYGIFTSLAAPLTSGGPQMAPHDATPVAVIARYVQLTRIATHMGDTAELIDGDPRYTQHREEAAQALKALSDALGAIAPLAEAAAAQAAAAPGSPAGAGAPTPQMELALARQRAELEHSEARHQAALAHKAESHEQRFQQRALQEELKLATRA